MDYGGVSERISAAKADSPQGRVFLTRRESIERRDRIKTRRSKPAGAAVPNCTSARGMMPHIRTEASDIIKGSFPRAWERKIHSLCMPSRSGEKDNRKYNRE